MPSMKIIHLSVLATLLVAASLPASAENWVKYGSAKMQFPTGEKVVSGYSESSYDSDSVRYLDGPRFEVRLRQVTYIGDLVPHEARELLRVDCLHNTFESLVENPGNQAGLTEVNRGEIGRDSAYRVIKETLCGFPRNPYKGY